MPDQTRLLGGLIFSLALTLAGCNSDSGSDSPDSGGEPPSNELLEPGPNEALLYYKRLDADYAGWGLHLWNDAASG